MDDGYPMRVEMLTSSAAAVLMSLLLCLGGSAAASDHAMRRENTKDLELLLKLNKETYLLGEPIWAEIIITNVSDDTLPDYSSPTILNRSMELKVISDEGDTLKDIGGSALIAGTGAPLPPGESRVETFDVLDYYGEHVKGTIGMANKAPPGTYRATAASVGLVSPPDVRFEVVRPEGHDAEIYAAMVEAVRSLARRDQSCAEASLQAMLPGLEGSPYHEAVLHWLSVTYLHDVAKRKNIYRRLLDAHPDGGYARLAVSALMREMSLEEAEAFARELERKAPDTRASRYAQKSLVKKRELTQRR